MQYEDTVRIATPEGIEVEMPLAGIGSRLAARCIDLLIIGTVAVVALFVYGSTIGGSSVGEAVAAIIGVLIGFAILWVYDVAFEAFGGGRTPGKRALGLRVVGERGEPIALSAAAVRNVMRIVDEYMTLWLGALISMVRSERNQRLGDVAASAMVVKEATAQASIEPAVAISSLPDIATATAWDTTAVTDADLAAARRFLERRYSVDPQARSRLANELYSRLAPKVPGAESVRSTEQFVELVVALKARRG